MWGWHLKVPLAPAEVGRVHLYIPFSYTVASFLPKYTLKNCWAGAMAF